MIQADDFCIKNICTQLDPEFLDYIHDTYKVIDGNHYLLESHRVEVRTRNSVRNKYIEV